jgi:hypothetical protein
MLKPFFQHLYNIEYFFIHSYLIIIFQATFENADRPGIGIETVANDNIEIRDNFISGAFIGIRFSGGSRSLIEVCIDE